MRMKYRYAFVLYCILNTIFLHAKEDDLSAILKNIGEKKILTKPTPKKHKVKKQTRFVFKDTYETNSIEKKDKSSTQRKSKSYNYENKPRFQFKFSPGVGYNNLAPGQGINGGGGHPSGTGSGVGSGGGHQGRGGGGGGHR